MPRPGPGPMRATASARVATIASGTAMRNASAIPAVAIASVSSVAFASRARNSGASDGGKKPARKLAITRALSPVNSCAGRNSARTSSGQRTTAAATSAATRAGAAGSRSRGGAVIVAVDALIGSPAA